MFLFGAWEVPALFRLQVKLGYQLKLRKFHLEKNKKMKSLSLTLTQPHLSLFDYEGASIRAETPPSRPSRGCGLLLSSQRYRAGQRVRQWQRTNPDRPNRAAERGQPPLHRQAFPQIQHHQEPQLYPFWHFSDCKQAVSYDLFLLQSTKGLSLIFRRPQHTWEGDWPKGKAIWEKQAHLHTVWRTRLHIVSSFQDWLVVCKIHSFLELRYHMIQLWAANQHHLGLLKFYKMYTFWQPVHHCSCALYGVWVVICDHHFFLTLLISHFVSHSFVIASVHQTLLTSQMTLVNLVLLW